MRSDAYQALLCLLFSPAYHIFRRDTMAAERKTFQKGKTEKFAAGHLPFSEKYGTAWSLEPQISGQLTQSGGFGGSACGSEPHKRGQPNTGCSVMLRMRSGTVSSDDCARTGSVCCEVGKVNHTNKWSLPRGRLIKPRGEGRIKAFTLGRVCVKI